MDGEKPYDVLDHMDEVQKHGQDDDYIWTFWCVDLKNEKEG